MGYSKFKGLGSCTTKKYHEAQENIFYFLNESSKLLHNDTTNSKCLSNTATELPKFLRSDFSG